MDRRRGYFSNLEVMKLQVFIPRTLVDGSPQNILNYQSGGFSGFDFARRCWSDTNDAKMTRIFQSLKLVKNSSSTPRDPGSGNGTSMTYGVSKVIVTYTPIIRTDVHFLSQDPEKEQSKLQIDDLVKSDPRDFFSPRKNPTD